MPPLPPAKKSGPSRASKKDIKQEWARLSEWLKRIFLNETQHLSFESLYRDVYRVVLYGPRKDLFEMVLKVHEDTILNNMIPQALDLMTVHVLSLTSGQSISEYSEQATLTASIRVLKYFESQWGKFIISLSNLNDLPFHMMSNASGLRDSQLDTRLRGSFRDKFLFHRISTTAFDGTFLDIIFAIAFYLISLSRRGISIDRKALHANIVVFLNLYATDERSEGQQLYTTTFEPRLVSYSNKFFAKEAQGLIEEDTKTWLTVTKHYMEREINLYQTVLWGSRHRGAIEIIESQLIQRYVDHQAIALHNEMRALLWNKDSEQLKLLYQNISRVDAKLQLFQKILGSFISDLGKPSISFPIQANKAKMTHTMVPSLSPNFQQCIEKSWIIRLLELEKKLYSIWSDGLESDPILESVLSKSFSALFRDNPDSSKLLSEYLDIEIRAVTAKKSRSDDHSLMEITSLLQYISDMATFECWYKIYLSERLLQNYSLLSLGLEREIIDVMRIDIGDLFADELYCLIDDIEASGEIAQAYLEDDIDCKEIATIGIGLSVKILTKSSWPSYLSKGIMDCFHDRHVDFWPLELKDTLDRFTRFYTKQTHRSLVWLKSMGTATMICNFPEISDASTYLPSRQYQLVVPTQYMIILLLFNDTCERLLSPSEIAEKSALPLGITLSILEDLTHSPECQILLKLPVAARSDSVAVYIFNDRFTSESPIIMIPGSCSPHLRDHENDLQKCIRRRERNSIEALEACIVRIMKGAKTLSCQSLLNEVILQQGNYSVLDIGIIEKRICSLVNREYLKCLDLADGPGYKYLI